MAYPVAQARRGDSAAGLLHGSFLLLLVAWFAAYMLVPHARLTAALFQYVALGAVLLALVAMNLRRDDNWRVLRDNRLLWLFLGYVILNAILLSDWSQPLRYALHAMLLLVAGVLLYAGLPVPRGLLWPLQLTAVVAVVTYALLLAIALEPATYPEVFRLRHALQGVHNPNHIASALLPVAAGLLVWPRAAGVTGQHALRAVAVLLVGWVMGLCLSFAVLAGLLLGAGVVIALRRPGGGVLLAATLLAGCLAGVLHAYLLSVPDAIRPLGWSIRLEIWRQYLELWSARPWLGHGFASKLIVTTGFPDHYGIDRFNVAHNVPLHVLVQGGVVGLVLFLALALNLLRRMLRLAGNGYPYALVLGAMAVPVLMLQKGPLLHWPLHAQAVLLGPVLATLAAERIAEAGERSG